MEFFYLIAIIFAFIAGTIYRDFMFYKRAIDVLRFLNSGKTMTAKEAIEQVCQVKLELKMMNKNDAEMPVSSVVKLKHEVVNDVHYFFTAEGDKFVAQGKTLEEAALHYTKESGADSVGFFKHVTQQKMFCFVDNKCMDYVDESSI